MTQQCLLGPGILKMKHPYDVERVAGPTAQVGAGRLDRVALSALAKTL